MPEEPEIPDELDRWLRAEEPYLDNGSFARELLGRLPPRRRPRHRRRLIKAAALVAGIGACAPILGGDPAVNRLVVAAQDNALLLTTAIVGLAAAVALACVWIVLDRA